MDVVKPMDVIRIYEFGTLKFIGYVQRVSYGGSIANDGKPSRNSTITCQQMGGLLAYASIGIGLGTALGLDSDGLIDASAKLSKDILDATQDGISFTEMLTVLVNGFFDFIKLIGGSNLLGYINEYFDATSGLTSEDVPGLPRTFELFTGTEQSITFWDVAEQLVERPFNEFWIDNGPRKVSINGKDQTLPEKVCLVFRPTPFNGSKRQGSTDLAFDSLPILKVDRDHLVSFDLSRNMDEVYTMYSVKEAAFQMSEIARLLLGQFVVDTDKIGQYLLKPLITELFFTRMESVTRDKVEMTKGKMEIAAKEAAETLYNWFRNNDQFLSGVISMMVPTDPDMDPKIGQRIQVYGLEGQFYVEGIAHTWAYQGALKTDLTVTRGFNGNKPMILSDSIFNRSVTR